MFSPTKAALLSPMKQIEFLPKYQVQWSVDTIVKLQNQPETESAMHTRREIHLRERSELR